MQFDLSGVQAQGALLPDGDYVVTCEKAEIKDTKSGGQMVAVVFNVEGHPQKLFHNFNVKNDNEVATRIGLGQLKAFLKAANYKNPDLLEDIWHLNGLKCKARLKTKFSEYRQEDVCEIQTFKPMTAATAPAAAPGAVASGNPFG